MLDECQVARPTLQLQENPEPTTWALSIIARFRPKVKGSSPRSGRTARRGPEPPAQKALSSRGRSLAWQKPTQRSRPKSASGGPASRRERTNHRHHPGGAGRGWPGLGAGQSSEGRRETEDWGPRLAICFVHAYPVYSGHTLRWSHRARTNRRPGQIGRFRRRRPRSAC